LLCFYLRQNCLLLRNKKVILVTFLDEIADIQKIRLTGNSPSTEDLLKYRFSGERMVQNGFKSLFLQT